MRRHLWKVKELNPKAKELAKAYNISTFLAQVFLNRGIKKEDFASVLDPKFTSLHCPSLLPDIEKAVVRIKQAVQRKEKVLVFGDYDVDGITSLAIFHEFAKEFPKVFSFYIPHRIQEGYGLSKEAITKANEEKVSLIITFDCGTGATEEIELAKSLKIDVIVVDHHLIGKNSIEPFAFINPRRKDSKYPFKDLSAGALSFKLLQALTDSLPEGVLDLVEKEDRDSITVWEPFEHHVGEAMCEVINDMLYSLDRVYPETKQKSELKITVYRGCVESVKQDGKDINYTLNDLDINT